MFFPPLNIPIYLVRNLRPVVSSLFRWMHVHIVLTVLWFPAGANSKHVDLKLKKLVDVSPRGVTSPSSPSSSSSSPTASSASPVSPAEGQEVHPHLGRSYFPPLFPSLSSSFLFIALFLHFTGTCLSSLGTIKGSWDQWGLIVPIFQGGVTWCKHQSVKPLHVGP